MKNKIFLFIALFIACVFIYVYKNPILAKQSVSDQKVKAHHFSELRSGDIVFQENESGQGKAIQLATHSNLTHCGIVFTDGDQVMVYEAVQPVRMVNMADWVKQGQDGKYLVKRLKNAKEILTSDEINKIKNSATPYLGKDYDIYFNWSDEEIYCSEFVWKIYRDALAIELCPTRPLGEYDLSHPEVKNIMKRRYGDKIPLNEQMVSPGDLFESSLLEEVPIND